MTAPALTDATRPLDENLRTHLEATHVEIIDNSAHHAEHVAVAMATGGIDQVGRVATHVAITVVSPRFEGVSLLDRHRMVHQALKENMATSLHALELQTYSPSEWSER